MNKIYLIGGALIASLAMQSCMSSIGFDVMRPADVALPSDVKNLAVVKRNEAKKGKKLGKAIEGMLSGEGIGTDKRSAEFAVNGLVMGISKSPKFSIKQVNQTEKLYGTGTSEMAAQLSWEKVDSLCEENDAQALVVLESFDSDVDRDTDSQNRSKTVNGKQITETVFTSSLEVQVKTGWRIYYPKDQRIIDEHYLTGRRSRSESAATSSSARSKLPSSESMIKDEAQAVGNKYAVRISPTPVKVVRSYYGKGSEAMKLARSKVAVKDWAAAMEIWQNVYDNTTDNKLKGKAAFNLAVGNEALSDFDKAMEWVKIAADLGNKKAAGYLNKLERRKQDENRLKSQMEN